MSEKKRTKLPKLGSWRGGYWMLSKINIIIKNEKVFIHPSVNHYPNVTIDQNFPKYGMHRNFSVGGGDLAHDWQGDPRQQPHRYLREEIPEKV